MNKFVLTLLCGGSLMTLSGCGKEETKTKEVATEVAVADATPVATDAQAEVTKEVATEVAVADAVVVEEKSSEATQVEVSTKKQDDKF